MTFVGDFVLLCAFTLVPRVSTVCCCATECPAKPPAAGRVLAALDIKAEKADATLKVAIAGEARVEGLAVHKSAVATNAPSGATAAAGEPVVSVGRVVVSIKDAQPLARVIALDALTIENVDLKVTRAKDGRIDLLDLANRNSGSTGAAAQATPAATGGGTAASAEPLRVTLRELVLRGTTSRCAMTRWARRWR
jgi:hypothetical protein